jgi:anti-sigma B factor antagonist
MTNHLHDNGREHGGVAAEVLHLGDGRRVVAAASEEAAGGPSLRVRVVERTALVRLEGAEILFEEEAVRAVGRELHRLIEEAGHTRLVVSFAGVRYVCSEVLGILAGLQRGLEPVRGSIALCDLDPLLRDMVRITHLDRVFDVCGDEAEALGLMLC